MLHTCVGQLMRSNAGLPGPPPRVLVVVMEYLVDSLSIFRRLLSSAQTSPTFCLLSLVCRIVCKLNTRTSILAATNPKGELRPSEPLSVSVALASPLLSRFDLVLVLLDNRNADWDRVISSFILEDRGRAPMESLCEVWRCRFLLVAAGEQLEA